MNYRGAAPFGACRGPGQTIARFAARCSASPLQAHGLPSSLAMNTLMLALVLSMPVAPAPQQPDAPRWTASELPERLASEDLTEVAWAAYLVRRDRVRVAVPAVRLALARLAGCDELIEKVARLHLLDTLIQLDVRVPGEELLPHATGLLRVPALILAAKAPEANSAYFA